MSWIVSNYWNGFKGIRCSLVSKIYFHLWTDEVGSIVNRLNQLWLRYNSTSPKSMESSKGNISPHSVLHLVEMPRPLYSTSLINQIQAVPRKAWRWARQLSEAEGTPKGADTLRLPGDRTPTDGNKSFLKQGPGWSLTVYNIREE